MGNAPSAYNSWTATFKEIKSKHDAAYTSIERAITLEEEEKPQEAVEKYKEGIQFIDEALQIQVTCPERPDFSWEKACAMIQKMKKTRAEVLMRINSIQGSAPEPPEHREPPPSYDEAMSTSSTDSGSTPQTYSDLANALNGLKIDSSVELEAEVVYMYEGVKLYFISPSGEVSSTMRPQTMRIIVVENEGENVPRAILQIGDWVYPLIPGVSPCYRTDYGAFILPNVYAETPGSSIGIILPTDTDADVYELLESILYGIVGKGEPPQKEVPPQDLSHKISGGIVTGAWYLSKGLIVGAEKVGNLINQGTPKLINKIDGAQTPTEINPKVQRSMQLAEGATNKAAKVTGYVADQIGIGTMKLCHFLAPHIEKQGTRLLKSGFRMSEQEASAKMKGVLTVAAGAVEGFSTVYHGLENSASILGKSLKENTVKVVQHKYGQPAGEFAVDTLNTMGNVIHISHNAKIIHPKNLAKRTVKEAGKAMAYEHRVLLNDGASTSQLNDIFKQNNSNHSNKDIIPKKE